MKPSWNIDDVPVFVSVVEFKGISAASNNLKIPKSTVSKSLARLEKDLGMRLLERNSRNLRITSEGEAFYRQCLRIMEEVNEANSLMSGLAAHPSGRLTVALPIAFTREIVAPKIDQFCTNYPDIELEILVTSSPVDIIRDQIDLAVVVGALGNSELVVKTLYKSRLTCVSSPAYAADNALTRVGADLQNHVKICESRYALRQFPVRINGQKQHIDLSSNTVRVNDPLTVREAVINGFGVALIPNQYCEKQIRSGQLIPVFEHVSFDLSAAVLSVIYPSRQLMSNKTRAFLDFLVEICGEI